MLSRVIQPGQPSHLNANIKVILDRYKQIEPKFVFAETEIVYAGKTIDLLPKIAHVTRDLRTHGWQKVVLLPGTRTGKDPAMGARREIPLQCATLYKKRAFT